MSTTETMAVPSELKTELLREGDIPCLEQFLSENGEATIFHSLDWRRVIQETYGHQCTYWVAWAGQKIAGVFPVVVMRCPLLGAKMVAMPYQFHSGLPLATSEAIKIQLVEHALSQARQAGVKYLEIRHLEPTPFLEEIGFLPIESQLVTTVTPLADLDLKKVFRGHREFVGYASKRGVLIVDGKSLDDLRTFRRLYLAQGRTMGSPQAGWNFFANLHRLMGSRCRLKLAWLSGVCLGGLLTLDDGRTVFARCIAGNSPEARKLHISKALYWQVLSEAAQQGRQSFNWGISWAADCGLIRFKEGWNGTTRPAHLYVYPLSGAPPAPGKYFASFSLAKAVWRRLPLSVVDWAGRTVTHWVG
jgi:GNAT acetyltransferase-like protein